MINSNQTLQTKDSSTSRHFGTGLTGLNCPDIAAPVLKHLKCSLKQTKMSCEEQSTHFSTSVEVSNCLGSEVSISLTNTCKGSWENWCRYNRPTGVQQ